MENNNSADTIKETNYFGFSFILIFIPIFEYFLVPKNNIGTDFSNIKKLKSYKIQETYNKFLNNIFFDNFSWSKLPIIKDSYLQSNDLIKQNSIIIKCCIYDIHCILNNLKNPLRNYIKKNEDISKNIWNIFIFGLSVIDDYNGIYNEKNISKSEIKKIQITRNTRFFYDHSYELIIKLLPFFSNYQSDKILKLFNKMTSENKNFKIGEITFEKLNLIAQIFQEFQSFQ